MKLRRRKVADATRDDSKPRYAAWTTYSTAVRQIITAPRRSIRAASLFSTAASTVAPSSHGKAISHPHTKSREPTKAATRAGVDENAHKRRAQGLTPGPLFLISLLTEELSQVLTEREHAHVGLPIVELEALHQSALFDYLINWCGGNLKGINVVACHDKPPRRPERGNENHRTAQVLEYRP